MKSSILFHTPVSRSFAIALAMVTLSACTGGSSDPNKIHEPEQAAAKSGGETSPGATAPVQLSPQQTKEIQKIKGLETSSSFQEREAYFLEFKNWERTEISQQDEFKALINSFQREALQSKSPLENAKYSEFFQKFCNSEMTDCKHVRILKSSPYTTELMTRIAEQETDVGNKLRLNLLALEVSNQVPKESTALLLVSEAKNYRAYLDKNNSKTLLERVNQYLEVILSNSQSGYLKISQEVIAKSMNLLQSTSESNLSLAGKVYGKNSNSSEEIKNLLLSLNENPNSYFKKIKWLEQTAPQLIAQLKVKKLESDSAFLGIEQVAQRNWTSKQAAAFLNGAEIKGEEVEEKAKLYVKSMVAYIIATIQSDLFESYKKTDGNNKTMFFYDAGLAINPRLIEARQLIDQLKVLVNLVEDLRNVSHSSIRQLIERLPETFRLTVTDAATIALFDRGLKLDVDGTERFPVLNSTWSGYKSFFNYFNDIFAGTLEPMIQVTPLTNPKSFFKFNEALEFALRSNYFGRQPTDGDEALSRLFDFYTQIDVYAPNATRNADATQTRLSILNRSLKSLRNMENISLFNYAKLQCDSLSDSSSKKGLNGTFDITGLEASTNLGMNYWDLKTVGETRIESSNSTGATSRISFAIFPANSIQSDTMEFGRLDFMTRAEQFLEIVKAVESDSNLRFPKFKKKIDGYKALYAELYNRQYQLIQNFLPCWYKLVALERENTANIVKYDKAFWAWAVKPENRQKANSIFTKDLPIEVKYRSHIDETSAAIANFDLFFRARYYLMYGFPELNLPAISPAIKITISSGLAKTDIYKGSQISTVNTEADAEAFAINATRASGFKSVNSSVRWYGATFIPSSIMAQLIDVTTSLFTMGPMMKSLGGVEKIMSAEEMVKINADIFSFLNLTPTEKEALKILGEPKRFQSYGKTETPFIYHEDGSYLPLTDNLSRYLVSNYMGNFGNPAIWEDPKNNMGLSRPQSLLPLPEVAKSLQQFNQSRKSFGTHLFSDDIKSTSAIAKMWKNLFQQDYDIRSQAMKLLAAQKPVHVSIQLGEDVEIPGSNPAILGDLKNRLEDFKKYFAE